jgi:hypothetical protein
LLQHHIYHRLDFIHDFSAKNQNRNPNTWSLNIAFYTRWATKNVPGKESKVNQHPFWRLEDVRERRGLLLSDIRQSPATPRRLLVGKVVANETTQGNIFFLAFNLMKGNVSCYFLFPRLIF